MAEEKIMAALNYFCLLKIRTPVLIFIVKHECGMVRCFTLFVVMYFF